MMGKIGKVTPELAYCIINRACRRCELCNAPTNWGEIHHIVGRRVIATEDNLIYLCHACHRGEKGIHGRDGYPIQLFLRIKLQEKYFRQGKSEDEVRQLMGGKIFLKDE